MKKTRLFILVCLICISWTARLSAIDLTLDVKTDSQVAGQTQPYGYVKIEGRKLLVDFDKDGIYELYFIKGVGYSPYPIGRQPTEWNKPNIFNDSQILHRDFSLLQAMNCNTIRIWKGDDTEEDNGKFPCKITRTFNPENPGTLDIADEYGIKVIAGFWIQTQQPRCEDGKVIYDELAFLTEGSLEQDDLLSRFRAYVNKFKWDPAILFWAIGNENNFHIPPDRLHEWYAFVDKMAEIAHEVEDPDNFGYYHPVAVVNGDIMFDKDTVVIGNYDFGTTDAQMSHLDIWGANVYRGDSFGELFSDFAANSDKPIWIAEYGVDAWHVDDWQDEQPGIGFENQDIQAQWVGKLWDEIAANSSVAKCGISIGATVMEYSDEWWKPIEWEESGIHDYDGVGPTDTDCPPDPLDDEERIDWWPASPDNFFNSEWWGIMAISRPYPDDGGPDIMTPRLVYYTLQDKFADEQPHLFLCGDANADCSLNIGDPVYLINYSFKGGPAPEPLEAGDANGDGSVNIGDAVYLLHYIFKGGPAPVCVGN
ncbi:MAG: hypothetical protein KJ593_00870 [Candidatus Omnitrophica bacterium]|nr:hypothetical protein [Candidatus Omnitrophota bacterium]